MYNIQQFPMSCKSIIWINDKSFNVDFVATKPKSLCIYLGLNIGISRTEKWNENSFQSRSRTKSEMKMAQDGEWKVTWICPEIEKWNFSRNSWEPDIMQTRLSFLHHVFSNVSSKCLPKMMQSYIGCICLTFSTVFFIRPRCTSGPIYGSGCLSLADWLSHLLAIIWCDSGWWTPYLFIMPCCAN